MNKKLIKKDDKNISFYKEELEKDISFLQNLYNSFKAIGFTIDIADLLSFVNELRRNEHSNIIEEFIKDSYLSVAKETTFNGIPLNSKKVREMIDVPDISAIKTLISNEVIRFKSYNNLYYTIDNEALELQNDKIFKHANAHSKIEEKHTHFTQNERGLKMFDCLNCLCDGLNQFEEMTGIKRNGILEPKYEGKINGIEFIDRKYRPNIHFIREFEKTP